MRPAPASTTTISDPSLTLSPTSPSLPSRFRPPARDVHRRLIRLERDERVLRFHRIAGLHEDLDDRDVGEIADIGNLDFDRGSMDYPPRHARSPSLHRPRRRLRRVEPVFFIASVTFATGSVPSSASAFNAATVT
jgi:hypothetical protein